MSETRSKSQDDEVILGDTGLTFAHPREDVHTAIMRIAGCGWVYHGYFDHNPAHLLPRPEREVNEEIFHLIGDAQTILDRSRELLEQGRAQLGLQVLDVLIQADPGNVEARKLRIEILEEIGSQDYCIMSRNAWVYFINRDKEFLRPKGEL